MEAATLNSANLTNANLTGAYLKDFNFDQRRQIKIYDATIFANGTASFSVGDIETVADTINQLPASTDSNQPGIKELLDQLLESIKTETELKEGDKSDAIEELQNLAEASQDDDQNAKKTKARKSLRTLVRIVNDLPPTAALIDTCQELLTAIAKLFE